jgi:acetyl-CoA carboxylase carboxyl transferase subunit alpha
VPNGREVTLYGAGGLIHNAPVARMAFWFPQDLPSERLAPMANNGDQERFAYDFELPVVEVEKRMRELAARPPGDAEQLAQLEQERDGLLKEICGSLSPYQRVKLARHPLRPHPTDYVRMIVTDFVELHGDRRFGDDQAIVAGLGKVRGRRCMILAMHKGKETRDRMAANFGMPQPEGYRKALHKMRLAEKFGLPLICLIDTPGAAPAVGAEERGQAMAIAENLFVMAGLAVPIVVLVTGEGCSGGALGIGVGDRFAMLENAYYSVISPEGCAAILWKDGDRAPEAAVAMKLTATDLLAGGIIDTIVPEPLGGAHRDPEQAARHVETYLAEMLRELSAMPLADLLEARYQRYRRIGVFEEPPEPEPEPDSPAEATTD